MDGNQCAICLSNINTVSGYRTPCKHDFHLCCMDLWMSGSGKQNCPICRHKLSSKEIMEFMELKISSPVTLTQFLAMDGVEFCRSTIMLDITKPEWYRVFKNIVRLTTSKKGKTLLSFADNQIYFAIPEAVNIRYEQTNFGIQSFMYFDTSTSLSPPSTSSSSTYNIKQLLLEFEHNIMLLVVRLYPDYKVNSPFQYLDDNNVKCKIVMGHEVNIPQIYSSLSTLVEVEFIQFSGTVSVRIIVRDIYIPLL
jgi:hypothetical protein